MNKLKLVFFLTLVTSTLTMAQGTLGKGGRQLNAGFGLSRWGVPVYVGADFGVHESITIGPRVSFRDYRYKVSSVEYRQNLSIISFNGNYHFNKVLNIPSPWDFYAGLTLGYYIWSDVRTSTGNNYGGRYASTLGLDAQIGGRYFFNDRFGLNLEIGGGTGTEGIFGITYKF